MTFHLHPHQIEAEEMLRASLRAGHRRPMLQAVTGFGKTVMSAKIFQSARSKGKRVIFKQRFGIWPRNLADDPVEPDAAFQRWLKSRQIAFAKRRQKERQREQSHAA